MLLPDEIWRKLKALFSRNQIATDLEEECRRVAAAGCRFLEDRRDRFRLVAEVWRGFGGANRDTHVATIGKDLRLPYTFGQSLRIL